jgi:hypothetical protein
VFEDKDEREKTQQECPFLYRSQAEHKHSARLNIVAEKICMTENFTAGVDLKHCSHQW